MKALKFILIMLLLALAGAGVGYTIANSHLLEGVLPGKEDISPWYLLYIPLGIFLALTIHELGHLLTGLFQGFSFEFFSVGFLGIKRDENRKVKVFFNTDLNTFGGVAATSPREFTAETLQQFSNVILAGPLTSLIFSLLALLLIFFTPQPLSFILFVTGMMSFMVFLAVTLPSRTGIFYTDRKRYQRLKSTGIERDIETASIKAHLLQLKKEPITQMDPEELALLTQDPAPIFQYIGYYYLVDYHRSDVEKVTSLKAEMAQLEEDLPKSFVTAIHKEVDKL